MINPSERTLYLMVTCCMEESRFEILRTIIDQLLSCPNADGILRSLHIFDNGSRQPGTIDLLKTVPAKALHVSSTNRGFWSAIRWTLDNVDTSDYDYIHIIESDMTYYDDLGLLGEAERFLDVNPDVGGIRLQEYSVAEQHLYNKSIQHPQGRRYAWVSHVNSVTGQAINLKPTDNPRILKSNFLTCLHCINRLAPLRAAFDDLGFDKEFSEPDFQRYFHARYPIVGVLDGGLFHAKLGFTPDDPKALSGSWSSDVTRFGYRTTRHDTIQRYGADEVISTSGTGR